jgi:hypothetical protein
MDATPEIIIPNDSIPNDLASYRALIEQLASTVTSQTNAIDGETVSGTLPYIALTLGWRG